MNKQQYRIVFNKARGQYMAVAEVTRAQGKDSGNTPGTVARKALLSIISLNLALSPLFSQMAHAQIVADPTAPGTQRPTVLAAPNGVPVVNIQTPSAAGVSRNTYTQFDVNQPGAILNNSRSNVQSRQGGWIQGNPWLARGEARIILNEVNSANPSQIKGYVEIAGQRAEIVVANPAGINVDGGGFINASRAVLTTGTPQMGAGGSLDGYRVDRGTITINGKGLDASLVDYTGILARAAQVNAGIWTKELGVVVGNNTVTAAAGQNGGSDVQSSHAPVTAAPQFALDVSQLGGMYAGKISLVGTEAGVGVRNAGAIGASAGQVQLSADGMLTNSGTISGSAAGQAVEIDTKGRGLNNSGTIASQGDVKMVNNGATRNSGAINAARELQVRATELDNSQGALTAARLDIAANSLRNTNGAISQTGLQDLRIEAQTLSNTNANGKTGTMGATPLTASGGGAGSGNTAPADTSTSSPSTSSGGSTSTSVVTVPEMLTTGVIAAGQIENAGGSIVANGATDLTTSHSLSNSGSIQLRNLSSTGTLDNSMGTVSAQNTTLNLDQFNNVAGSFYSQNSLQVLARNLNNAQGSITTGGSFTANVQQGIGNQGGTLASQGDVSLNSETLDNSAAAGKAGTISSNTGSIAINAADSVTNRGGMIQSVSAAPDKTLSIATSVLDNTAGTVTQGGSGGMSVTASRSLDNSRGQISSNGALALNAGALVNTGGIISAQHDITAQTTSIDNSQGKLLAQNALTLNSTGDVINSAGQIGANEAVQFSSSSLRNDQQGHITSGNGTLAISTGALNNQTGSISARQDTHISSLQLVNAGGQISAGTITIDTHQQSLSNALGRIASTAGRVDIQSGTLNNQGGVIQSSAALSVATGGQSLNNAQQGLIASLGKTTLMTGQLDNSSGRIQAGGTQAATATTPEQTVLSDISINATGAVKNMDGLVQASRDIGIAAQSLDNTRGSMLAGNALTVQSADAVKNSAGKLLANAQVQLKSGNLVNDQQGQIGSSASSVSIATGALNNQSGVIASASDVTLGTQQLDNTSGQISGATVAIDTHQQSLVNDKGKIVSSAGTADIQSGKLSNEAGLIQGATSVRIDTHGQALINTDSGTSAGIFANDAVNARASVINNEAGYIGAGNALTLQASALDNNAKGRLYSGGNLSILAQPGSALQVTSRSGTIQAKKDLEVLTANGTIDNTQGLIYAGNTASLQADRISNQATRSTDPTQPLGIQANQVAVVVNRLDNQSGSILAASDVDLVAGQTVDNTQGMISAGSTLNVRDTQAAPGTASRALNVINTGGTLIADGAINIDGARLNGDGHILSDGDLHVSLTQDYVHRAGATLQATGTTTLSTQGDVINEGKLLSAGSMQIAANNVTNATRDAEISAKDTRIAASGTLTNWGLIDGYTTRLNAGTLNNWGTGRIYGDSIAIQANILNNESAFVDGKVVAPAIAARQRLDIGVQELNNNNLVGDNSTHAEILSLGSLHIGGALDEQGHATGQGQTVNNRSSTIESGSDMHLAAALLNNLNMRPDYVMETGEPVRIVEHTAPGNMTRYSGDKVLLSTLAYVPYLDPTHQGSFGSMLRRHLGMNAWGIAFTDGNNISWLGERNSRGLLLPSTEFPHEKYSIYYSNPPQYATDRTVRECTSQGDAGETCSDVTYPGKDYAADDRIWSDFGVKPYTQPKPVIADATNACLVNGGCMTDGRGNYWYERTFGSMDMTVREYVSQSTYNEWTTYKDALAAWTTQDNAARYALDLRLYAYYQDLHNRWVRDWVYYDYDKTTSQPIPTATNDPAVIQAGANLRFDVTHGLNDASTIKAGGQFSGAHESILNKDLEANATITSSGQQVSTYFYTACKSCDDDDRHYVSSGFSNTEVEPVTVTYAVRDDKVQDLPATGPLPARNTGSSVQPAPTGVNAPVGGQNSASSPTPVNKVTAGNASQTLKPQIQRVQASNAGNNAVSFQTMWNSQAVPSSSLFTVNPAASSGFLVETDPRFADYSKWLSSDYMLKALSLDPAMMQKRMGDGFYEQRLIREQVGKLTGRRFLEGFANDDAQYKALMDAGVTFASAYGIRPGVALTPEQMAQLTADIVWLVEQDVRLTDGSTTRALVPQVYVKTRDGDLNTAGALISAESIDFKVNHLVNTGTIAGRQMVRMDGGNLNNLGGRITAAAVDLKARQDINNVGGTIDARDLMVLEAGRDLHVASTTRHDAGNHLASTHVDRIAGLYLTGKSNGVLLASAGNNMNLRGAAVINSSEDGFTGLQAGKDIALDSVRTGYSQGSAANPDQKRLEAQERDSGSVIRAAGNVVLDAGQDVKARAAEIHAGKALQVLAGRDIQISAGQRTEQLDERHHTEGGDWIESVSDTREDRLNNSRAVASSLEGRTVQLQAGRDIGIKGSNVISDLGTSLKAGNNVTLEAAADKTDVYRFQEHKEGGFFAGDFLWGKTRESVETDAKGNTALASTVASLGGNVLIDAGNQYTQTGSHVQAPGGDVGIIGKNVLIQEAREDQVVRTVQRSEQSGITIGMGGALGAVYNTIQTQAEAADNTQSSRMQTLAAVNTGAAVYNAAGAIPRQMATANTPNPATGESAGGTGGAAGISLTWSRNKSETTSVDHSNTGAGSSVQAGGNVAIVATAAGKDSNLTIQGSKVQAGGDVRLRADNALNLLASRNTASNVTDNKNSSASLGVTYYGGYSFSVDGSYNKARAHSNGEDQWATPTLVQAGKTLSLQSGGHANFIGAQARGKRIEADIGGDLNIRSMQDTSSYRSDSNNAGGSFSIGYNAPSSGSITVGRGKVDSDYASVRQQSGLFAGDGGYDVQVAGNTDLQAGAILSSQPAMAEGRNRLSTGTLTTRDIQNQASYQASSMGVSIGMGSSSRPTGSGGFGTDSGKEGSTTTSAVSAGTIQIRDAAGQQARTGQSAEQTVASLNTSLSSEQDHSNALRQIFDKEQVQREIHAQMAITRGAAETAKAIGTVAGQQQAKALIAAAEAGKSADGTYEGKTAAQWQQEADSWGESGTYRIALHTALGVLTGGAVGAAGAAAAATAAQTLNQWEGKIAENLVNSGLPVAAGDGIAKALTGVLAGGVGYAAGGTAGAVSGVNEDFNNRQLHEAEKQKLARLKRGKSEAEQQRLDDAACALVKCSAEYAPGSSKYVESKAAEQRGTRYMDEQVFLINSGLFSYSPADASMDAVKYGYNAARNAFNQEGAKVVSEFASEVKRNAVTTGNKIPATTIQVEGAWSASSGILGVGSSSGYAAAYDKGKIGIYPYNTLSTIVGPQVGESASVNFGVSSGYPSVGKTASSGVAAMGGKGLVGNIGLTKDDGNNIGVSTAVPSAGLGVGAQVGAGFVKQIQVTSPPLVEIKLWK